MSRGFADRATGGARVAAGRRETSPLVRRVRGRLCVHGRGRQLRAASGCVCCAPACHRMDWRAVIELERVRARDPRDRQVALTGQGIQSGTWKYDAYVLTDARRSGVVDPVTSWA